MALETLISNPGVRRDGTQLDSAFYSDSVWVRWQRGKPRKMGGYRSMSALANGPVRSLLVDSRNGINSAHVFSPYGVQRLQFSTTGAGGSLEDRTPIGFVADPKLTWSQDVMVSSTGGSYSALLAASSPDIDDIASDVAGRLYTGDMTTTAPLTVVSDSTGPIAVSGGVVVLQPFCFVYGSNGLIRNSNANDFSASATPGQGWTTGGSGFANKANPAGTKIIYGAPVRGGSQSPAGLFWALDALIRVSFNGNAGATGTIWNYDTLSSPTSVLSKKAIVEHDGKFFWPGTDRFLFYAGVVQELPNQMNSNWFFDNLNFAARNKVWGTAIPRYGEIWWFYPRGSSTECDSAVIFNYNEGTWYDATKVRDAGSVVKTFQYPVWVGSEDSLASTVLPIGVILSTTGTTAIGNATLNFASTTGVIDGMFVTGDPGIPAGTTVTSHTGTTVLMNNTATIIVPIGANITFSSMSAAPINRGETVTGGTTGAVGTVARSSLVALNVYNITGTFNSTETLASSGGHSAKMDGAPFPQRLDTLYQHEFGYDKIVGSTVTAIPASFTSKSLGYAIDSPASQGASDPDVMTNVGTFIPDFNQVGALSVTVQGRSYPQDPLQNLQTLTVGPTDAFADFRVQERELYVKIESNDAGGFFEQGLVKIELSPGDRRSTRQT